MLEEQAEQNVTIGELNRNINELKQQLSDLDQQLRGTAGDNGFAGRLHRVEVKQKQCLESQRDERFLKPRWVIAIVGIISLVCSIGSSFLTIYLMT